MKRQYEIWNQGTWMKDIPSDVVMGGYCNGSTLLGFDVIDGECVSTPPETVRCAKCGSLLDKQKAFYGGETVHRITRTANNAMNSDHNSAG